MNTQLRPFHLALPVNSLDNARKFYSDILGCKEGRSDTSWVDFDFFGHQLVFHLDPNLAQSEIKKPVDGHAVPVPHCGIILEKQSWESLAKKITAHNISYIIKPYIRFKDQPGEQGTFFLYDFNNIALEFKYFKSDTMIFET